jgi:predicted PurR-regulated permease PerM
MLLCCVTFVSFDGFTKVAAVAGSFLALVAVEGQLVQPLLIGRRSQLNPLLVFLGLWFGGLFWGIAGIVLATPSLAALKVMAQSSAGGRALVDFLSPEPSAGGAALSPSQRATLETAAAEPAQAPASPAPLQSAPG